MQFSRLDVLVLHTVEVHQQQKVLPCNMCSRKFTQQRIVEYHFKRAHDKPNRAVRAPDGTIKPGAFTKGPFKCKQCERGFFSRIRLNAHRMSVHGEPGHRFQCDECPLSYTRGEELTRHSMVVHRQTRSYKCDKCSHAFTQQSMLDFHMQYHRQPRAPYRKRNFVCLTCSNRFHTEPELTEHTCPGPRAKSVPQRVVCDICGRTLSTTTALRRHKLQHGDARPAVCDVCGAGFIDNVSLVIHKETHRPDMPHVCHICGKGFKARSYLTRHVKFHSDNRPHVCECCGKAFKTSYTLQHHLRIHTGEKPFVCKVCSRPFRQSHQLKTHMKIHAPGRYTQPKAQGTWALDITLESMGSSM